MTVSACTAGQGNILGKDTVAIRSHFLECHQPITKYNY